MFGSKRRDPRVRDELHYHRDRLVQDYIAAGMDPASARRRAFLEFGNVASVEEQVRDARGRWVNDFAQDVRYALRVLRRSPAFACTAILSLALGIGANAGIFSVINGVMLQRLKVAEPERLLLIARLNSDDHPLTISYPFFERLRGNVPAVSAIAAVGATSETIVIGGEDELITTDQVSGSYFELLGIRPAAGRLLAPADDVAAPAAPAAVISDSYWQRRFGRDPGAVGTAMTIRGRVFTIVGVTPSSFHSMRTATPEVTLPLEVVLSDEARRTGDLNNFLAIARLKTGATVAQADAEVETLYRAFVQQLAEGEREADRPAILRQRAGAVAAPDGYNHLRYEYGRSLSILMGSVALVLLLACVNLSGLLLARAAARQREIAIRLAIGAGRARLCRQWLTESLVLASLGAAFGLPIAAWLARRLVSVLLGSDAPISVAPDWRVLAFTAAVAAAVCLLAGLVPAVHAVGSTVAPALKTVRARGSGLAGKALVVAQLSISMVLLVGATLFIVTLVNLRSVDRGFDARGLLIAKVRTAQPYPAVRAAAVRDALLERLTAMPGVRSVSAVDILPVNGSLWARNVQVEGYRFRAGESDVAGFNAAAPGYFATMRTPLLRGREFEARDTERSPRVTIVNESFARYFFGTGSAIGRHVTAKNVTYEIVGVVGDATYRGLRDTIVKTMYIPWTQVPGDVQPSSFTYIVRVAEGDPRRLVPDLRQAVTAADPALRLRTVRPYDEVIDDSIGLERVMATLASLFGLLALTVAATGLFGVLAFQVVQRTNEIGVRMALGADRRAMMTLVLRDVGAMVAIGVATGAAGAWMATGAARALLFGLTPTDPGVFALSAAVLAVTGLVAGWVPARRASRVDPLVALRHD